MTTPAINGASYQPAEILNNSLIVESQGRFSSHFNFVNINAIGKLALGAFALYALSNIPGASAGPVLYGQCVLACTTVFPPFIPACILGCLPLLAAPTP